VEGVGGKRERMENSGKKRNIESYKDLIVYQKSYRLALEIYRTTKNYPKEEIYGLISQMRRSSVSIPCNIAEGYRRGHRKEYIQFLHMAYGSCSELETLLSLSNDLDYIEKDYFGEIYQFQEEVSRLLKGLILSLSKAGG
jgi:four helix bundle protein